MEVIEIIGGSEKLTEKMDALTTFFGGSNPRKKHTYMKLDEEFEPTDDEFSLPDKLVDKVEKWWRGLERIVVEYKQGRSWKKVNGFAFKTDADGEPQGDTPEEAATMIVAIAAYDVEERGEEGTYRARFYRKIGNKDEKKTFSFKQGIGGDSTEVMDMGDMDAMTLFGGVLSEYNKLIGVLTVHVEAQNGRLLEQATVSTKQIENLLKANDEQMTRYHQGLAMQANAMSLMLDVERNLEADKQRGKNTEHLLEMMKGALPVAVRQLGRYMNAKAGVNDDSDDDDEDENEESGESGDEGTKPTEEELEQDRQLKKNLQERPLTTFSHAFRDSIKDGQWLDLGAALNKKEMLALKKACSSKKELTTAQGILELHRLISKNPAKLGELTKILSDQQAQMIMKLIERAEKFAAAAAESESKKEEKD